MFLLENQTGNTDGSQTVYTASGGEKLVHVSGVFDGATVNIEGSIDALPFTPFRGLDGYVLDITEEGIYTIVNCAPSLQVRAHIEGAGSGTDITVSIL